MPQNPRPVPTSNPNTPSAWASAVKIRFPKVNPADILLSHLTQRNSASKLTYKDFLCLKVIYKVSKATDFELNQYVNAVVISEAKNLLTSPQCKQFFADAEKFKNATEHPEDSIFGLVGLYMNMVFKLNGSAVSDFDKVLLTPRPVRTAARDAIPAAVPDSPLAHKGAPWAGDSDIDMEDASPPPSFFQPAKIQPATPPGQVSASISATSPEGWSPAQRSESEFTRSEDEMLVNMAFVLLLNALTERKDKMRSKGYRWVPNRDVFKIMQSPQAAKRTAPAGDDNKDSEPIKARTDDSLGNTKHKRSDDEKKLIEARTDGCLRNTKHKLSAVILEVKPYLRADSLVKIQWQEGAQMAAYIYTLLHSKTPPSASFGLLLSDQEEFQRRLLCSQDHGEIYITIATYDKAYEEYLGKHHPPPAAQAGSTQNGSGNTTAPSRSGSGNTSPSRSGSGNTSPSQSDSEDTTSASRKKNKPGKLEGSSGFLTMHTYGPWQVGRTRDLKSLCETLLALSLHLSGC